MSEHFDSSILNLARQQITEEYIKSKSEDLANWLLECDRVWKEEGTMLPYPTYSFYPSEEDIIARARLLVDRSSKEEVKNNVVEEKVSVEEPIVEQQAEVLPVPTVYKKTRKWFK